MAKKMTIVEQYDKVKALLNGEVVEDYTIEQALQFLTERSAQTAKKNASGGERKPTKTQLENEGIKEQILAVLTTEPMNIATIRKADPSLPDSSQKMTALLTQLVNEHKIVRTEIKGKVHYSLPTAE